MIEMVWEIAHWLLELIWNLKFGCCDFIGFSYRIQYG